MKKIIQLSTVALLTFSCSQEEISKKINSGEKSETGCYLSEITASNSESFTYFMEDGKVVKTGYGDNISDSGNLYDENGNLIETSSNNGLVIKYFYNPKNQVIRVETVSWDTLVQKHEYTYDNKGDMKTQLFTWDFDQAVQNFIEEQYKYKDGNPVTITSFRYNSENMEKVKLETINIKYDTGKNPYNTLNLFRGRPQKNNPIEYTYLSQPEQNSRISYTYNESGYPITYEITHVNLEDYPIVTGTFNYTCSQE